jgi:hypothetical protein
MSSFYRVQIVSGVPQRITRLVVHEFELFYEDPGLYTEDKYAEWADSDSESGMWVIEHAVVPPVAHKYRNRDRFSLDCKIVAELYEKDAVFFHLKWNTA